MWLYGFLSRNGALNRVIITSWNLNFIKTLRQLDRNLKLGYDPSLEPYPNSKEELEAFCDYLIELAKELRLYMICLREDLAQKLIDEGLAKDFIIKMAEIGCWVDVWTINKKELIKEFQAYGFIITTDLEDIK